MAKAPSRKPQPVFTLGHSTLPFEKFVTLLKAHGARRVIDIRTIPRSRHNPQYDQKSFSSSLRKSGLEYVHLKDLGGLRKPKADSQNSAWRNASFRGYADYMQTPEFENGLEKAIRLSQEKVSALVCAEALPWRCHRSLVSDAFVIRGIPVEHIFSNSRSEAHELTDFAKVRGTKITYPGG